jgi:hypothetical protein
MTLRTSLIVLLFSLIFISCSQSPQTDTRDDFENLPIADLKLISEFDQSGEYFFQFINGGNTIPLDSGDFILADRNGPFLIRINKQGDFVSLFSREGRGPGEILDPISLEKYGNSIWIYDQERKRIIQKALDGTILNEINPPAFNSFRVTAVNPIEDKLIHLVLNDFSFIMNPETEPANRLVAYQMDTEDVLSNFNYPGDIWVSFQVDGQPAGGAAPVPFTPTFLFDSSSNNSELYTFWPEDTNIYVLNPTTFDTLRNIPVNLPSEQISSAEVDSLQQDFREDMWPQVLDVIPDTKSPADKMIIDPQNRIWLKLTLDSEFQEWIVLDQGGSPQFRVQFPKKGMVTHVSDQHIGFRADDHLFALYKLTE